MTTTPPVPHLLLTTEDDAPGSRAGFRLDRLEMLNWGTFDRRVWTLRADGQNTLLTGDIGSGKSTIVDALSTLLLPAARVSYNEAAGAPTRERDLRSYVQGHWRAERSDTTGAPRTVGLRPGSTWTALLAVFRNEALDETVTLGQVFWLRSGEVGQPDRFHLVADRDLSIAGDLAEFGSDPAALRRRLSARVDVEVFGTFTEYGRVYRNRLGIASEQAMDLFHQTVSMKAVGDLNGFVRDLLLEPGDSAGWVDRLLGHVDQLTRAHDAVVTGRTQLAQLAPVLADADRHAVLTEQIVTVDADLGALPVWADRLREKLLSAQATTQRAEVAATDRALSQGITNLDLARARELSLTMQRTGNGGERLRYIDEQLLDLEVARRERRTRAGTFAGLLEATGLDPVTDVEDFVARRTEIAQALSRAVDGEAQVEERLAEVEVALASLRSRAAAIGHELTGLRGRTGVVPRDSLRLRDRLAAALSVDAGLLPFAGELVRVSPVHAEWAGAAERVLRDFALTVLVPHEHYAAVTAWVEEQDLGAELAYLALPAQLPAASPMPAPQSLAATLEVRSSPLAAWVETQVALRAPHLRVDDIEEFRRTPVAVTRTGQVKDRTGRHALDDRHPMGDPLHQVLGWDNAGKVRALGAAENALLPQLGELSAARDAVRAERARTVARGRDLAQLSAYDNWKALDWQGAIRQIAELGRERDLLVAASGVLFGLDGAMDDLRRDIVSLASAQATLQQRRGAAAHALGETFRVLEGVRRRLAAAGADDARDAVPARQAVDDGSAVARALRIDRALTAPERLNRRGWIASSPPGDLDDVDERERTLRAALERERTTQTSVRAEVEARMVRAMAAFRAQHPAAATGLDASRDAADAFRELHERLRTDELPRAEATFTACLEQDTVRDIAGFLAELERRAAQVTERIEAINGSLHDIDYHPGRYLALEARRSGAPEIEDFRADLRSCTEVDDADPELRFARIARIVQRLRGRAGHAAEDRRWARTVTDVRTWFVFSAIERWRHDDAEHETHTDAAGKSGGQKEKLAYTVLAASLAYQFGIDPAAHLARNFRFVVIDEAFGRGSDDSTRFALDLFGRLGLQLLVVTPLQKIHVIEPYVASLGYVDNQQGDDSRLQCLTVEDYRTRRALARSVTA
ncbi:ATP-binding protein [Klenkia terrae]|uniref:ATP-binding protein n=1 Tax=Klenkia terrae TaxID=1052259 RepID=UPI001CD85CCD|nr:ATP-binding protein [Klenkia terrae]